MDLEFVEKLEQHGVKRIKYYYQNTPLVDNVFTACLFITEDNQLLTRGIAICSLFDQHNKETGRRLAFKRATKALFTKESSDPISDDTMTDFEVTRKRKIKTKEDESILDEIDKATIGQRIVQTGSYKTVFYNLVASYPMDITTEDHDIFVKSAYKPAATALEEKLISK